MENKIMTAHQWRNLQENGYGKYSDVEEMEAYAAYVLSEQSKPPVDIEAAILAEYPETFDSKDRHEIPMPILNSLRDAMRKGYNLTNPSPTAVELIRECEEYLSDQHQQGNKSSIAINTISTSSKLHKKMQAFLSGQKVPVVDKLKDDIISDEEKHFGLNNKSTPGFGD